MIDGATNADSIPALERLVQFAGARHRILVHNIANLDTPNFRPVDVSVEEFQARLGAAIDRGREVHGHRSGALEPESSGSIDFRPGGLSLHPEPVGDNILFHDGNDRSVERLMQSLVENFMAFRSASELLRSRFELINTAIRERV